MIKTVGIDKDIKTTDKIKFILDTTDSSGCPSIPYKVDKVVIYFVTREFTDSTVSEYKKQIIDTNLQKKYEEIKILSCQNPSPENISKLNVIKKQIESSKYTTPFYFKDAIPVKTFGWYEDPENETTGRRYISEGEIFPAWLNPDFVDDELREKVIRDNVLEIYKENNEEQVGKFVLYWDAYGCREGDYFICWNWTPNLAGGTLSGHMMFSIMNDTKATSSIPIYRTKEDKYEILMDRYLPSMFKSVLSDSDLSPFVLQELNNSVAKGFTFLEDFANQIIDLLDANSIQEQMLPLLSNLFNLSLKSNDPTRWRKQSKKAIRNFKKKGTISGLKSALSDAGFELNRFTRLWQVKSKYTHQEYFEKINSNTFELSKQIIKPINEDHFELYIRKNSGWEELSDEYVEIITDNNKDYINWIGDEASTPIILEKGDSIRILYQFSQIPSEEEDLELYIRSLPLMDLRDEKNQKYPPKNWNTRVLDYDDPLFDRIVIKKHPIADLIIWGKIRTEFPYSENVYNMEEYNGSTRDSINACDIDKDFIDPCQDCQASVFSVDVGIEDLSNDRIIECKKTIEEFVPFHSLVHTINFTGYNNEFVKPPFEQIEILMRYSTEDVLLSGDAQKIFNRFLPRSDFSNVKRNILSQVNDETGLVSGSGYNKSIFLYAPNFTSKLDLENQNFVNKTNKPYKLNISTSNVTNDPYESSNLLEILSPSNNSGVYSVVDYGKGYFEINPENFTNINEPLDKSQFEFRISNKIYESTLDIEQKDFYTFTSKYDFSKIKIKNKKEYQNPDKLRITASGVTLEYDILEILPDNKLIIDGPDDSLNFNIGNNWEIENESGLINGSDGVFSIKRRGCININFDKIKVGDYVLHNNNQYRINSIKNDKVYIENYQEGNEGGANVSFYRRIVENCVGQLDYFGLVLETSINYENEFKIQNGKNNLSIATKPTNFKENYLIFIDSNYYSILEIDENLIYLGGPNKDWTTLGTELDFTIYKFTNLPLNIESKDFPSGYSFDEVLRKDNDIIYSSSTSMITTELLNKSDSNIVDTTNQQESININIEYKNGDKEEKQL